MTPPSGPTKEHELEMMRSVVVGGFLLFLCIVALFTLDLRFAGQAVDMETTAYIINASPTFCNFTVYAGYNIVSIPCLSTATPIGDVVDPSVVDAIYQYVPGSSDPWRVYNPNLPSYVVDDLEVMSRRTGYIALMKADFNRTHNGTEPLYTSIPLARGWTLVGYPSHTTRNVTNATAGINSTLTKIVMYDKASETFIYYDYLGGGTLENISPEFGYWMNVTAPSTWTVYP